MADLHFPILGTTTPRMIGRKGIMRRLWSDLTKKTPSHLSIVGPRYSGKTVLVNGLAERMRQNDSPYGAVIIWDLGHQTPNSNDEFIKTLCKVIGEGLKGCGNEYGEHLLSVETDEYNEIREVLDALNSDGFMLLMLWDGFDRPLSTGKLTRNLWDQLRELASNPSLRLVTTTRQPLHELIRSVESVTSDFWNIFDMSLVRVGVFDEEDQNTIITKTPGLRLNRGAISELENWSAGYPPFYLMLLNCLIEKSAAGEIDNNGVNDAAVKAMDGLIGILQNLWNDCPETAKSLYRYLIEYAEIPASEVSNFERTHLLEKGFIRVAGNKISKGCRLLENHIKSLSGDSGSMVRLFGPWEEYRENIRSLLELRLSQLTSLDATLRRFIQQSIEDIPDYPEVCLSNIRGVVDKALDLIWDSEVGPDRNIPADWFTYWKYNGEKGPEGYWNNKFPVKRGHQIRLLKLMTGTQNCSPKAKVVSKNTWALASAAQGFGDFGQHIDGIDIPIGVAVSAVSVCIELAACLDRELGM